MAKKLLVRQPKTSDGVTIAYDANRRPKFSEAIVEPWAKRQFESLNASLPAHLRYEFEDIDVPDLTDEVPPVHKTHPEEDLIGDMPSDPEPGPKRHRHGKH